MSREPKVPIALSPAYFESLDEASSASVEERSEGASVERTKAHPLSEAMLAQTRRVAEAMGPEGPMPAGLVRRLLASLDAEREKTANTGMRWRKLVIARNAYKARLASREPEIEGEVLRCSGDARCDVCELSYADHPEHPHFGTVLCSGRVVKL